MELENIKKLCDATLVIKRCIEDDSYLCEVLNSLDKNFIREYYKRNDNGPVVMLRKEICKEILLEDITVEKMMEIITNHKSSNSNAFKSWSSNFSILHTLIINKFKEELNYLPILADDISKEIKDVNYSFWDFKGGRNQGQEHLSIVLYNDNFKSHSIGKQMFINFRNGELEYGLYKHGDGYLTDPIKCGWEEFYVVLDYLRSNLHVIKDDIIDSKENIVIESSEAEHTFLSAAIQVLKDNKNNPMTSKEIWEEIQSKDLYKSSGKTPHATLNAILGEHSVNSGHKIKSNKSYFQSTKDKPTRYKLIRYVSDIVRDSLTEDGFITKKDLIEILRKNNINIVI